MRPLDSDLFGEIETSIAFAIEEAIYGLDDNALEHGFRIIDKIETILKTELASALYNELEEGHAVVGADSIKEIDLCQGILRIAVICPYYEKEEYVSDPHDGYAICVFRIFLKSVKWGSYNMTIFGTSTKEEADEQVRVFMYSLASRMIPSSGKWFNNGLGECDGRKSS